MARGAHENEIKLKASDVVSAKRMLYRAGFRVHKRRLFEDNAVFDTPQQTLRGSDSLLRLREAGRPSGCDVQGQADGVEAQEPRGAGDEGGGRRHEPPHLRAPRIRAAVSLPEVPDRVQAARQVRHCDARRDADRRVRGTRGRARPGSTARRSGSGSRNRTTSRSATGGCISSSAQRTAASPATWSGSYQTRAMIWLSGTLYRGFFPSSGWPTFTGFSLPSTFGFPVSFEGRGALAFVPPHDALGAIEAQGVEQAVQRDGLLAVEPALFIGHHHPRFIRGDRVLLLGRGLELAIDHGAFLHDPDELMGIEVPGHRAEPFDLSGWARRQCRRRRLFGRRFGIPPRSTRQREIAPERMRSS